MEGKAIIITAPSGSGKTSIIKPLIKSFPQLSFSISATTRQPRQGELDKKDYYFLDADTFNDKVLSGEFIEWEEVYPGKRYGTLKSEIDRLWSEGKTVIFDLEVKGALNLKKYFGASSLAIFIKVPSMEHLEERLIARQTESNDSLRERLNRAEFELSHEDAFDVTVVNDNLEDAVQKSKSLVHMFLETDSE